MAMHNMKKIFTKLFFLMPLLASGMAWSAAGYIQMVLGDATVWERTGTQRPAQKGVELYPGDAVVTAASSTVQIRLTDDTLLWVHPNSRLKIDQYLYTRQAEGKDSVSLRLFKGAVRTATGIIGQVKKDNFLLNTPTATIGIRGTDFDTAYVDPSAGYDQSGMKAGTYNRVYSGATSVSSPAGRVEVGENEAAYVGIKPGDKPERLKEIPEFMRKLEKPGANNTVNASPTASAQEIVTLRYRAAEDILPLLKPLLDNSSVVTGQGARLVIAAPAGKRSELKAAVASFDVPLRRLQVTIRFDNPDGGDSVEISSRSRGNEPIEQRIQVAEGQRGFFYVEQSQIPRQMTVVGRGVLLVQNPQPGGSSGSGLEVLPRLVGDNVSMEFYTQRSSVSGAVNKNQQTQRVGGTLSARLGEWVEAGGRVLGGNARSNTASTLDMRNQERALFMRVDEIQ